MIVLCAYSAFARETMVPRQFLSETTTFEKSNNLNESVNFANDVDHIMSVQQETLEKMDSDKHAKVKLTQLLTSFAVSKSGLFGLSALGTSSNTTLFWTKKTSSIVKDEVKTFAISDNDDELSLQMKIDDITDYLVSEGKVKDSSKLRENLDQAMRKGHELFEDMDGLESVNWKVGGYRLDLSISASGVVYPFTKIGENVRLWLEWTKTARKPKTTTPNTKATRFVTTVLNDIEVASTKVDLPHFELQNLYVGLGEDLKTGLFGFGSASFGFVGYVKFVKKPKPALAMNALDADSDSDEYPVIQEEAVNKSGALSISRNKIRNGIVNSLKYVQFFANKSEKIETTHWEMTQIREIASISKSGFFGLSNLNTKGVFIFIFNKKKPASVAKSMDFTTPLGQMTLIRLSFVTALGYSIPEIANFELRPNIELFWK